MTNFRKIISALLFTFIFVLFTAGCESKDIATTAPAGDTAEAQSSTQASTPSNVIEGSGVLEAEQDFNVSATVTWHVVEAPFEEGQKIKAGDLLYKIDQTDILNNIEKAKLEVKKAQLAYDQNTESVGKLSIRSKISGKITGLYVHNGDLVAANSKIADVVSDDTMVLKVPFLLSDTDGFYVGQSATITESFDTVTGKVKKISSGNTLSSNGSLARIVEIDVLNPGAIVKGAMGLATIGNKTSCDPGTFEYSDSETIVAEASGTAEGISLSASDKISEGEIIARLDNDALISQEQQYSLSLEEAKLALDTLNNSLKNYNITSPIDGVAVAKNVDKNDILSAANMANMADIADLSKITFKMKVDEFDVSKIKIGQTVTVTVDAVPSKEFKGTVEYVNQQGTQVSGVPLYDIKVRIENAEGLMPGMNANAKIDLQ